ncbi:MAG: hypothetical protein CL489_16355 [Acidobacteria bacterium]|nr:hypothetical protein [Acidobacteriota bacterium]
MTQKTNLNVTPYYDDYAESDSYHRVLFRPGFAVQARELTQLQTILQKQIQRFSDHIFKEGAIVIPGNIGYDGSYHAVKLQSTFSSAAISSYLSTYDDSIITGATSGVKARVVGYTAATADDPETLFVKYISSNTTDNATEVFSDNENISSSVAVGSFLADAASATTAVTAATATGSALTVQEGIFYIRGNFVQCSTETLILDKYTNSPSYRVGFTVTEALVTPEDASGLLDNATGATNYAAKGAHRLKVTLALSKYSLTSTNDADFVELFRVESGAVQSIVDKTNYSVIEEMIARRTFDESGDYIVSDFKMSVREDLSDGTNNGLYTSANGGSESKLSLIIDPGKAYIKGHEVHLQTPSVVRINKARTTTPINNDYIPFSMGNYAEVTNIHGSPDISNVGSTEDPFKIVKIYDTPTATRGVASGAIVGVARSRAFEYYSGTAGATSSNATSVYKHYLFDIQMMTNITMSGNVTLAVDAIVTGSTSGATGTLYGVVSAATDLQLLQVSGTFVAGEAITGTGTGASTGSVTISSITVKDFSKDAKQLFMTYTSISGGDYSADVKLGVTKILSGTYRTETGTTNATSLLAEALDTSETGVDVDTGTEFAVGQVILAESEQMKITAISTNTLTVTRGFNGTTAATHSDNVQVEILDHLIGVSGYSTSEIQVGDVLTIPTGTAGATQDRTVMYVASTYVSFTAGPTTDAITTSDVIRNRTEIKEQEETVMIMKMPHDNISSLLTSGASDTTYTVRRQFHGTTNGSGAVSFSANSGEAFSAHAEKDYTLEILTAGGGGPSGVQSDLVTAATGFVLSGSPSGNTLTITNNAVLGTSAVVKLTGTLSVGTKAHKTKTANKTQSLVVNDDGTTGSYDSKTYGHRVGDKEISLGVSDTYAVHAVYHSAAIATAPVQPELTMATSGIGFTRGEIITGSSSAATGVVIVNSGTSLKYVKKTGTFTTSDTLTGASSALTGDVSAIAQVGNPNILSRFELDTGQRDSFYDISRLVRKPNQVVPTGQLSIVYSNFSHGTGDYFSADSYGDVDYDEIPYYIATKVDPETQVPTGTYQLASSLDFRPTVANIAASGTTEPFSFNNRTFEGTGSATVDMVKVDDTIRVDYSYYLGRWDMLFLKQDGQFQYVEGAPAENPKWPTPTYPNSMAFAKVILGPYTFGPTHIAIQKMGNQRFTMKDIGNLQQRIKSLEYYTALGLLETDTQTFQIQDANGLDRFKSGFFVDNFTGHQVADATHPDLSVAIGRGIMRPKVFADNVTLIEENTTDTTRTADGYQKTGKLFTLPYTHEAVITQAKASRTEFVNPFNIVVWMCDLTLDPQLDTWRSDKFVGYNPVNKNVDGGYDQLVQRQEDGLLGTIWGEWVFFNAGPGHGSQGDSNRGWHADAPGGLAYGNWHTSTTDIWRKRTGIEQAVQHNIVDGVSVGDKAKIDESVALYIRSRDVNFSAANAKPLTRMYAYFDKIDVSAYSKPTGSYAGSTLLNGALTKTATTVTVDSTTGFPSTGTIKIGNEFMTYTGTTSTTFTAITRNSDVSLAEAEAHVDNTAVSGSVNSMPLITDSSGALTGTYTIPNSTALKFQTGIKEFRLTDSATDSRTLGDVLSAGSADYTAAGINDHIQETLHNIDYGKIVGTTIFGDAEHIKQTNKSFERRHTGDPLAQTFLVQNEGGMFITKVDVFFYSKDESLPVTVDVRTVENGYPTLMSLPGSQITKVPADVNVDTTGTANTVTTFTFDAPIYCDWQKEYAIVLRSNSQQYKVWISQVGETEVGGTSSITTQPSLGSLFKAQRATTWTADQLQDLKFTLYRAKFDTAAAGLITLTNEELTATSGSVEAPGIKTLPENPLKLVSGDATVKINFKNHGMHSTSDNVIISGVESDVTHTLLNGSLDASATTITVDSQAAFPSTGTIKIDDEIITYSGKSSTTGLTGCTRGASSTTAATHEDNSVCALYMIAGISLVDINKTHTVIANNELDSFTIEATSNATSTIVGGGDTVTCTRNIPFDSAVINVETMNYSNTATSAKARSTTGKSINGSETPFSLRTLANEYDVPLHGIGDFAAPQMICSQINETNESIGKSYRLNVTLSVNADSVTGLTSDYLSPVMSTEKMSLTTVSNRVNQVDSSSNIGALTDYIDSNQAEGDNNEGIYISDKITLNFPASALKVYFSGNVMPDAEVEVMYKILRTDENLPFDDKGWTFFNTTGVPDTAVPSSKTFWGDMDFKEYEYSADSLEEFISFAIKIVLKSTNSSYPPVIKRFRSIALAT